jgi:hypothetical protein
MFTQNPLKQSIRHKLALVLALSMIAGILWHSICLAEGNRSSKNGAVVQKDAHEHYGGIEQNDHFHFAAKVKLQQCHLQDLDDSAVITKSTLKYSKSFQKHFVRLKAFEDGISLRNNQSVIKVQNLIYTPNNSLFNQKTLLLVYS